MFINILIVEDESIVAMDLEQQLKLIGHNVVRVETGEDALKILEKDEVDLIFMDIRLNGILDGLETMLQIRNNFNIPVIYISANSDLTTLNKLKQTRPYQYLIKPFTDSQIQSAINNCLMMIKLNRIFEKK